MCLQIVVALGAENAGCASGIDTRALSALTGLTVTGHERDGALALHFSAGSGCACDLLGDKSVYGAREWTLEPAHLPALARAVTELGSGGARFSFLAHWLDGERPRATCPVTANELAALVSANRVGNNVLYQVG